MVPGEIGSDSLEMGQFVRLPTGPRPICLVMSGATVRKQFNAYNYWTSIILFKEFDELLFTFVLIICVL